uniref:proteasomal ATPase-associated factor 1-like isoform X2 n=1 Tax=Ciona intestinalis TaxID=7719 RepID=UPI000EF526E6|nr:proteasomal ATPase-associated factor 1-like isoform X2 [Ciona intestinalis]|eukprot:XP_026690627.1 proteasomal ATPase-associated factor 1-like isoform X2 [Ciona intestinalis]
MCINYFANYKMETTNEKCSFLIIQCDWDYVLRQHEGKAWVSLKHFGFSRPTSYGTLKRVGSAANGVPILEASDRFTVDDISARSIKISHTEFNVTTTFHAPITTLDISKEGGLGVSACVDGTFNIWDTNNGMIRRKLVSHVGEVNCCNFFPSGMVVMSGGMDTQVKIWSAEDGTCARTLNGSHKCGILSLAAVGRGRNIVSASRDGSLKLWECSSASCVANLLEGKSEINFCCVTEMSDELETQLVQGEEISDAMPGNLEFDTEHKVATACCENGEVIGVAVLKRSILFEMKLPSAVNCCCYLDETILVVGLHDGSIVVLDIKNTRHPLAKKQICGSPVLSLSNSNQDSSFWASFGDGRCSLLKMTSSLPQGGANGDNNQPNIEIVYELTGPDCDPVYKVNATKSNWVFTASRDGVVRKYKC